MLEVRLSGQFTVRYAGTPVEIPSRPAQSLLAFLALNAGVAQRRERLAGLLWPDTTEANARAYLRMALWRLHKSFEAAGAPWQDYIDADDIAITFQKQANYWLDSDKISEQKDLARWSIPELQQCAAMYVGELLPGFYEEWIGLERARLQACFEHKMFLLIEKLLDGQSWDELLVWAERWIAFGNIPEPAYRALMVAHAVKGNLAGVRLVHQRCLEALESELGVSASSEFEALYRSLIQGEFPADALAGFEPVQWDRYALPPSPGAPPYKGLAFFEVEDAALFFGRERLTAGLISRLEEHNFLAVVGASGSGKSSLARAGLAASLARANTSPAGWQIQTSGPAWIVRVITPTGQPLASLASGLAWQGEPLDLQAGSLLAAVEQLLHRSGAGRLLLVVDQFEELFTLCRDQAAREAFIDQLLECLHPRNTALVVVIALRADFYAHCSPYPAFARQLAQHQEFISPMDDQELRRAIEEPARQGGWDFEPGLVDLFLRDAREEPGALPLLSHALLETWLRRSGKTLSLRGYADSGGVRGAIAKTAQRVYYSLPPDQQLQARSIFLRLTEVGEGTRHTRRRATVSELMLKPGEVASIRPVLEKLAEARLITISQESVEVSHEALIREWPTLRQWLDEDREGLRLHRHMTEAAQAWEAMDRDEGELYGGLRLAQAAEWAKARLDQLNLLEREFLEASLANENQREAEREAQRQRDLESAQKVAGLERARAEEHRSAARRLRRRAYQLSLLVAALVILAGLAIFLWRQAVREAQVNQSLALAASAQQANQAGRSDLALALALEAISIKAPPPEAIQTVREIASGPGTREVLSGHQMAVLAAAISPDQSTGLSGSCARVDNSGKCQAGELIVWDLATGSERSRWTAHRDWVNSIAVSLDGVQAISGSADGSLILWDLTSGGKVWEADSQASGVASVGISPDGKQALAAGVDGSLTLWDAATGALVRRFEGSDQPATEAVFSPDGRRVLLGASDGSLTVWETSSGLQTGRFEGHALQVNDVAITPDGKYSLSTSDDLSIRLWDNQTGQIVRQADINCRPEQLSLSPDGSFAMVSCEHLIYQWDIPKWREHQRFIGHTDTINDLAMSSDGRLALSASSDGSLRVWNLGIRLGETVFELDLPGISALSVSPDGERLLLGSDSPVLWQIGQAEIARRYQGFEGSIAPGATAISPDGQIAAAGGGFWPPQDVRSLVSWDLETGETRCRYRGHDTMLRALAFSPDSRTLLAGSQNPDERSGDLILWDVQTCEMIRKFDTHDDVSSLAFNADGSQAITGNGYASRIIRWDVQTGEQLGRYQLAEPGPILDLAFGPGGETILGSWLDRLVLWDTNSGEIIRNYFGHAGMPWSLDLSPDGEYIISGSQLGEVILWNFTTGEELFRSTSHAAPVYSVAFNPDGRFAYSASEDGRIIQWRVAEQSVDELRDWIRANRYERELTCEERQEYRVKPLCAP